MESKTINNDINAIKEPDNKSTDNMRSMIDLLLKSANKISGINKKTPQIDNKEPDDKFTDNMRSMIDLLLRSVNKISEVDKKIVQIDKVIKYPYGTAAIEVCENEMRLKDKLNRFADDENMPIDKDKDNDRTICIIKDKTKSECKNENMLIKVCFSEGKCVKEEDIYWVRERHVIGYWNNNNTSEIEEKWIFHNNNYVYIRVEKASHVFRGDAL